VKPVSIPTCSRVASSASVVPPCRHCSMKAASAGFVLAAAKAIGCSGATATKETPMTVSARVVKTCRRPSPIGPPPPAGSVMLCGNAKRTPWLLPIQFACIVLTRSGQPGKPVRTDSSSSSA
jgi:hypothetical protein